MAILAGSVAGDGPEGRVVDRRGVWWTGGASRGPEVSWRGISGPESVAAEWGKLGNIWNVESTKRGLLACTVESPLTTYVSPTIFVYRYKYIQTHTNLLAQRSFSNNKYV